MRLPSRTGLARYFLRLGATGFGGPIALVGGMHRELVERRGWVSEEEYREGVALAQLSPGPLAAQLCFYLGWLRGGWGGAALSGLAFVLPSFVMVVALGWAYTRYGTLPWMQGVFYGVGAAVIGLIARSAVHLSVRTVGRDRLLGGIFLVLAAVTALTARENVWLILLAGVAVWLVRAPPRWLGRSGTAADAASLSCSFRSSVSSPTPGRSSSGAASPLSRFFTAAWYWSASGSPSGNSSTRWRWRSSPPARS